ncbi:DUF4124 domain-containing protein [Gilvimarinus sp. DA14]|uniref:DUF4124 domain-containing protein n=1 Tax=Gilvimarinus sp. DA14 TaxID=2956798 RepID=UPI0020B76DDA|nr:DUF4124 domain-containing protein [Gilvimarinus sp. DA14]UTF59322.1 DUF4124 domain-containing protein [Gilvimarinus sp. DA14]
MRLTSLIGLATCFTALCFSAQAEVYKSVDKYGNVTYTDDPSSVERYGDKAEKITVPPTNVVPGTKPIDLNARPQNEQENQSEADNVSYNVRIVSPTNEYTVTPGQRDLIIAAATDRPLQGDAEFAYYMDGELLGRAAVNNFSIREILRGEHQIRVDVLNAMDEVLGSSETVTVYVHRASVLSP